MGLWLRAQTGWGRRVRPNWRSGLGGPMGVALGARQRPDGAQVPMQGPGQGRVADGRRADARGAEGPVVRPGQLAPALGAAVGDAAAPEDGVAERRARAGDAADVPHAMAMALALAPKVRRRASQDRVERVERDMPRHGGAELEDEDLLDAWGDGDGGAGDDGDGADGAHAEAGADGAQAAADVSREAGRPSITGRCGCGCRRMRSRCCCVSWRRAAVCWCWRRPMCRTCGCGAMCCAPMVRARV